MENQTCTASDACRENYIFVKMGRELYNKPWYWAFSYTTIPWPEVPGYLK
jgi:hypothetical protein